MLALRIRPSRLEMVFLCTSHGVALFALTLSSITPFITLPLAVLVVCSLLYHAGLLPNVHKPGIQQIQIAAHQCRLITAQQQLDTTLPHTLFFSEWLIILRFDELAHAIGPDSSKIPAQLIVHLLPDSLDAESDRQLRSYLRFQQH